MKYGKKWVGTAFAVLGLGLMATGGSLVWVLGKVRAFERDHGADVFANRTVVPEGVASATNGAPKTAAPVRNSSGSRFPGASSSAGRTVAQTSVTNGPMRVLKTTYDGDRVFRVTLSARPDMDVVRHYLSVGPMAEGTYAVRYATPYNDTREGYDACLVITGDFAYRTNVTLRLLKGLPRHGEGVNPSALGSLAEDYACTFRRKDQEPYVKFAAEGRYLPPSGRNFLEIESVNVSNICTEVCRVEPRNVVQLLAREENVYEAAEHLWSGLPADAKGTRELSGKPVKDMLRTPNRVNRKERSRLAVSVPDGKSANGIYLVSVENGDCGREEDWRCDFGSRNWVGVCRRFRLVCVSDLGLSVRWSGADAPGVWVTSLTSGRPVAGAIVEVYSSSNTRIFEGAADAQGWCVPKRVDEGEPFAVVVYAPDAADMTFMALSKRMGVDETQPDGGRADYLAQDELEAFVWSERGIYRHGEPIFLQTIVRNGRRCAPVPMPVELRLVNPGGKVFASVTRVTDLEGTAVHAGFAVPAEQPSGVWTLQAKLPGKDGRVLGAREIRIEEFAPPQVRVSVAARKDVHPTNFAFTVTAEHLFGGPATGLRCAGAVVFEDIPFAPVAWKGWHFGNDDRGFKPSFRELSEKELDSNGQATLCAPVWADSGLPKAAVRATGQGVVFEDGGRPATARQRVNLHYYPYYIGSTLGTSLKLERGLRPTVPLVCVAQDGKRLGVAKELVATVERIDSVYSYRTREDGWQTWDCERIRTTVATNLAVTVPADGNGVLELPVDKAGDYALTVCDPDSNVSYGHTFYLSDWADDVVRAPLANPTAVTVVPDKAQYRVGERPKLLVKSPFAGSALVSVMRDNLVYAEVHALTNATSVLELRPVAVTNAPNVNVYVSVIQSVAANANHLAVRAHGQTTVRVLPAEEEIPLKLDVKLPSLRTVDVTLAAPGATAAYVTVVDEGINLLTDEPVPDPVGRFAAVRESLHPMNGLYDLYHHILPVTDEGGLKANGVKTGGGFGAEMLGRVSPVPTRRFKPLARWSGRVAVSNGVGRATVALPEFVGEVRVTAVAWSASATGSAAEHLKVAPKLVMQPDAPRFVAPGDRFEISLPLHNRSGKAGEVDCSVDVFTNRFRLGEGASTNVVIRLTAPSEPGELRLVYRASGFGETHEQTIELPVRPAVAARETAGVTPERDWVAPTSGVWSARTFDSPIGELSQALKWLADYPHGCLEQTSSRIFPLIGAGGLLNRIVTNGTDYVVAGVRRVESMVRSTDFVMWPDCNYAPWDREVSLYAAHFLAEARRSGIRLNPETWKTVKSDFLTRRWSLSTNEAVSAYACHTLALAGSPNRDRMLRLYDRRDKLSLLSRARLARAFVCIADRRRAEALLANATSPASVKEAAFALMALLELDPDDPRTLRLLKYLNDSRDRTTFSWGTTGENAHALLAIASYYRHHPPKPGERFVAWRKLTLPAPTDVKAEAHGIALARRFLKADGSPADLRRLRRGELLVVELELAAENSRTYNDLVIQDLFAGAFEPVHGPLPLAVDADCPVDWVMRSDARDDRMLVFSKKFALEKGKKAFFRYPVRVVSAGAYVLPGPTVEAMYSPELRASCTSEEISIK